MDLEEKKDKNKRLLGEIVRFLLVGGLATVCDYAVYLLFRKVVLPAGLFYENTVWNVASAVIATTLGFLVGLLINWVLSVVFVFRDGKRSVDVKSK